MTRRGLRLEKIHTLFILTLEKCPQWPILRRGKLQLFSVQAFIVFSFPSQNFPQIHISSAFHPVSFIEIVWPHQMNNFPSICQHAKSSKTVDSSTWKTKGWMTVTIVLFLSLKPSFSQSNQTVILFDNAGSWSPNIESVLAYLYHPKLSRIPWNLTTSMPRDVQKYGQKISDSFLIFCSSEN